MSNATTLQTNNTTISNNNLTIDDILDKINNLPEAGEGKAAVENIDITINSTVSNTTHPIIYYVQKDGDNIKSFFRQLTSTSVSLTVLKGSYVTFIGTNNTNTIISATATDNVEIYPSSGVTCGLLIAKINDLGTINVNTKLTQASAGEST